MAVNSVEEYRGTMYRLFAQYERSYAVNVSIGGNYIVLGELMVQLLLMLGLRMDMRVVDVGCGPGRLAAALERRQFKGQYTGLDVSHELVEYAHEKLPAQYAFKTVDGFTIPEHSGLVDFVCFFALLPHLLHEESYLYLQDAKRALKPGGRIVVSYMDFAVAAHWQFFENTIAAVGQPRHYTMFMGQDMWNAWAAKLGLEIEFQQEGGIPFIPIDKAVTFDNGVSVNGLAAFGPVGQSIIVLKKP